MTYITMMIILRNNNNIIIAALASELYRTMSSVSCLFSQFCVKIINDNNNNNNNTSPIANKYREGKLKRTLKREFNSTKSRFLALGNEGTEGKK